LDIISLSYGIYQVYINPLQDIYSSNTDNNNSNNLSVSFNLLKNKINTLLDRKNDLTITQINTTPSNIQKLQQPSQQIQQQIQQQIPQSHQQLRQSRQNNSQKGNNKFSTPISQLQNKLNNIEMEIDMDMDNNDYNSNTSNMNTNSASTPINLIRQKQNIPEPIINEETYQESVAGSDLGSIMDLDDFEKSL